MDINFEKLFLLENLTNHIPLGLIFISPEKKIGFINKKAESFLHSKSKSVENIDIFSFFPQLNELINNSFSKKNNQKDALVTSLDGNKYNLDICPINDGDIFVGWLLILKDLKEIISTVNKYSNQEAAYTFDDIIGESPQLKKVLRDAELISKSPSTVLITGESGCGKELLAQSIHNASNVSNGPFIALNCGAIPKTLIESELFGYEEGAFTGAKKGGRPGLFEFAHQGTLFLDEVEGMSLSMQVKLLRVLQEGEIMRVGGGSIIRVDVRIVAATNESLEEKIQDGSFRKDLYYRLNALTVEIPPLRKRGDDIFLLLDYFMRKMGGDFTLAEGVKTFLRRHPWPGNIRELQNAVEYFNYLAKPVIGLSDLPPTMTRFVDDGSDDGEGEVNDNAADDREADMAYQAAVDKKQFVLNQLALAWKEGKTAGREKILEAAKKDHISMTQKQVRDLLDELAKEGLIQVGRGRGGSKITEKGLNKLKIN